MANESALASSVTVGRLGVATLTTAYGVLCAGTTATSAIQNAGAGAATEVLTSNGAAALPTWEVPAAAGTAASQAEMETGSATNVYVSPGRQQFHDASAKVWVNIDADAGAAAIRESYNVTSVTWVSAGNVTVTIATDFADANYAITAGGRRYTSNLFKYAAICLHKDFDPVAGSFRLAVHAADGTTYYNCLTLCAACYGDFPT